MLGRLRGVLRWGAGSTWPYRLFRTNIGVHTSCKSSNIGCLDTVSLPEWQKQGPHGMPWTVAVLRIPGPAKAPAMLRVKELGGDCGRDSEGSTVMVRLNQPGHTTKP